MLCSASPTFQPVSGLPLSLGPYPLALMLEPSAPSSQLPAPRSP